MKAESDRPIVAGATWRSCAIGCSAASDMSVANAERAPSRLMSTMNRNEVGAARKAVSREVLVCERAAWRLNRADGTQTRIYVRGKAKRLREGHASHVACVTRARMVTEA